MFTREKKILKVLTVVLAFSFAQIYVQAGLPSPGPGAPPPQGPVSARLIASQPITVNGNALATGGTILTGATIETPDQVGATIDLGDGGVIELQPGARVQLDFDANGNVRVKVLRGCAVTKKTTSVLPGEMEIYTDVASEKTDKKRRNMGFCFVPANGGLAAIAAAASTAGGLSAGAIAGIVAGVGGGTAAALGLNRGENSSFSGPN